MKTTRKLLSVLLAVTMVLTSLTVVPLVSDVTAEAETNTISSSAELTSAVSSGGEYQLTQDLTGVAKNILSVQSDISLTIDLNGHKITRTGTLGTISGTLTIKDTSENNDGYISGGTTSATNILTIASGGVLNIQSGSIKNCKSSATSSSNAGVISNEGTINLSGTGKISGVEATTTTSTKLFPIYNTGTINMTGGTISGIKTANLSAQGICNAGAFNMSGGSITGCDVSTSNRRLLQNNSSTATMTLSGGEISGNEVGTGYDVFVYNGTCNVSDSFMINGALGKGSTTGTISITGGWFKNAPTLSWIASYYEWEADTTTYTNYVGHVKATEYKINYNNLPSDVDNSANPTTYTVEDAVTLTALTGCHFKEWTIGGTATTGWAAGEKTGDVTVDASTYSSHTITYENLNGATAPSQTTFYEDDVVTLENNITDISDEYFTGWHTESASGTAITGWNAGDKTADVTVYASWGKYVASVTIGETTTYYKTLEAATTAISELDAVDVTATIELLEDQDLGTTRLNPRPKTDATSNARNLTFDLNGHTITYSGSSNGWIQINNNSTYTIKNGTINTGSKSFIGSAGTGSTGSTINMIDLTWQTTGTSWQYGAQTINITSGTYSLDPTSYAGHNSVANNGDGTWTVTKSVASVTLGNTTINCTTLQEAIERAVGTAENPVTESTIKLLDDITLTGRMNLRINSEDTTARTITFDANGKTITTTATSGFEIINAGTTLNITGNGTWSVPSTGYYFYGNSGSTINVLSGTFTGATSIKSGNGSILIKGGTWNLEPTTYAGNNDVIDNSDGTWTVAYKAASVTIGETTTKYATLAAAFSYLDGLDEETTATITLLDDIELSSRILTNEYDSTKTHNYTLDLNGYSINYAGSSFGFVLLRAYNYLTITDSKDTGVIDVTGSTGTIKSIVYTNENSKVTFENGIFKGAYVSYTSFTASTVFVNGGIFYFDPTYSAKNTTPDTGKNTIDTAVITVNETEGIYTIGVCRIDNKGYSSLPAAVAAAVDNDTITICANITLTAPLQINKAGGDVETTVKNLTFTDDGGGSNGYRMIYLKFADVETSGGIVIGAGKTVSFTGTSENSLRIRGYGSTTVDSVTTNTYCNVPAIALSSSSKLEATLNLTNVKMLYCKPTNTASSDVSGGAIYNDGSYNTINIDNCLFENNQATSGAVVYLDGGTCNITDSEFYNNTAKNGGVVYVDVGKCEITGSTFGKASETVDDEEKTYANTATANGSAVYNKGTLEITNSTISNNTASSGGTIYNTGSGQLTVTGTTISNNRANRGAAIYNNGASASTTLGTGTIITGNKSYDIGGAIYAYSKSGDTGNIYLGGTGIQVKDNYDETIISGEDGSSDTEVTGYLSNISLKNTATLVITDDISGGEIGIDYSPSEDAGDYLPVTASSDYPVDTEDLKSLKCDAQSRYSAYAVESGDTSGFVAVWNTYQYEVTVGKTMTNVSGYSYQLNDVTVTQDPYTNAAVISIVVDSGYFTIPWDSLDSAVRSRIVRITTLDYNDKLVDSGAADGSKTVTIPDNSSTKYKAITIYVSTDSRLNDTEIINFIKLPIYNVTTNAVAQDIYVGLQPEFLPTQDEEATGYYFAGGFYTYHSESLRWSEADNKVSSYTYNAHLVSVHTAVENSIVHAITGGEPAWLGAIKLYDAWYWQRGYYAGTQITGNTTTTEGYNGAYTNFANTDPFCETTYGRLYMTTAGKWKEADGESTTGDGGKSIGCLGMVDDECARKPVGTFNITRTDKDVLTAMGAGFEDGLQMNYYFTFSEDTTEDSTAKVIVQVGKNAAIEKSVSTIIAGEATSDGDYMITIPVAPKQMADEITVKIVKDGGATQTSYGSGTGYNLQYYAFRAIINNRENESDYYTTVYSNDFADMAKAMLWYGSAAQSQFGYNTSNLADATLSLLYPSDSVPSDTDFLEDKIVGTFSNGTTNTITGAALVSDSTTGLRIYFTGEASTATVGEDDCTIQNDGSENYIEFSISAKDLSKTYSVTIGDASCQINAYYVIAAIMDASASTPLEIATAYRLYEFGEAAATYYGAYKVSVDRQYALINTAYAYLQKSEYVDYDQKNMTESNYHTAYPFNSERNPRRQLVVTPEDATEAKTVYMDCSSFVYDVYYDTFGEEAALAAFGYADSDTNPIISTSTFITREDSTIVPYTAGEDYTNYDDSTAKTKLSELEGGTTAIFAALRKELQPGDLIVMYRYADTSNASNEAEHGHVVLWTGDGFIHCSGKSYNYEKNVDNVDEGGAIKYVSTKYFETALDIDDFHCVKIIRPLAYMEDNSVSITEEGTARQQMGETGFSLYGTRYSDSDGDGDNDDGSILYDGQGVEVGDTIEYVLHVDNTKNGGAYNLETYFNYSFTLPTTLEYVPDSIKGTTAGSKTTLPSANEDDNGTISISNLYVGEDSEITIKFRAEVVGNTENDFGCKIIDYADDIGQITLVDPGVDAETISLTMVDTPVETTDENYSSIENLIKGYADGTTQANEHGLALIEDIFNLSGTSFGTKYTSDAEFFRDDGDKTFNGMVRYYTGGTNYDWNYISGTQANTIVDNTCYDYLVSNLVGGRCLYNTGSSYTYFEATCVNTDNRARSFTTNNLMKYDVIACMNYGTDTQSMTDATYTYFIYLGGDEMLEITSDSVTKSTATASEVMESLLGKYDIFGVFRFLGR